MDSDDLTFLHGYLSLKIIAGKDVDGVKTSLLTEIERGITGSLDGIDPYCTVKLGYNSFMQTTVVENDKDPVWNASGTVFVAHEVDALEIRVKAAKKGLISKVNHLAMLSIPAQDLVHDKEISGWFPLTAYQKDINKTGNLMDNGNTSSDSDGDDESNCDDYEEGDLGQIQIELVFTPIDEYVQQDFSLQVGLSNAYYPVREGVDVSMYQDADVAPGMLPEIPFLPDYQHKRCWIDVSKALMDATELIYITGWAVWPEVKLVRTEHDGDMYQDMTLGEMLKQKAEEGVTVCVMVWDEVASNQFYGGLMGTHDEEVIDYFSGSKVTAIKVSRQNTKRGPFADINDKLMFTHHQKTVVVSRYDTDMGINRLEAFVGGLDLTDGRYDNPDHSLFRTLNGIHAPPDFWQACALEVSAESGPREPWHDVHCKVKGAVAWDVLDNFECRWRKQAPEMEKENLYPSGSEAILSAEDEAGAASGSWNVQLLRSINDCSAEIDGDRPGLRLRRGHLVDSSIHNAYIHAIRRAKNHIFLENQYFLGSSHVWDESDTQRGGFSNHLVAIELAEKICAKIRAGQRFVVYLIVPLYPEGPPASAAVQEILSHQRKTVNLITTRIRKTINETGSMTSVEDWFAMFCLVNRESMEGSCGNMGNTEKEVQLSQSRRFMIYVHSKFAIFDDESAIIGSANINSRSMNGQRDTEIAALCWQPEHLCTGATAYGDEDMDVETPAGDVAAFRCALWTEHLGGEYFEEMADPSSLECVRKVREMATKNWYHFLKETEDPENMPYGHLATYPYVLSDETGEIITFHETFPDFDDAPMHGGSNSIPNQLTG